MEELIKELKLELIEALNLEEMTVDDVDENEALEIIVLLEKKYGIKLSNPAEGKKIFTSIVTIADFVSKNRKK